MIETLSYAAAALVLPPTSLVALALLGMAWSRRARGLGLGLAAAALLGLLGLGTGVAAQALIRTLEGPALADANSAGAQAIVILAGGRSRGAPEWGGEMVRATTLQRVRYGARLARETGLPILVTGGKPGGGDVAEAELMRDLLRDEFGIAARWVEAASETTYDNARLTAAILRPAGVSHVLLVTSASHMPRAQAVFERHGLRVTPAPTAYLGQAAFRPLHLVPNAEGLYVSHVALREWLGIGWYRLLGSLPGS
jgi:uncharacterized SAM-binding protein YcdF (DUF218 family)